MDVVSRSLFSIIASYALRIGVSVMEFSLHIHLNLVKFKLFSPQNFNVLIKDGELVSEQFFPSQITKHSHVPNLVILGAPIGDVQHCSAFVEEKRLKAQKLLLLLLKLNNPQVAVTLLCMCGVYSGSLDPEHSFRPCGFTSD
ncbi:hypothetical protein EMCRGX_G034687 [Ephydatia muelleri]